MAPSSRCKAYDCGTSFRRRTDSVTTRRHFLSLVAFTPLASTHSWAQKPARLPIVGILSPNSPVGACGPDQQGRTVCYFMDGLRALGLDPHARVTCGLHRCWLHQCVAGPDHVIPVTGHRWCRPCRRPLDVFVDETTARLFCPRCGTGTPDSAANRQVVRACRTSIAAMHAQ